jgi:hypothetical protein
MDLPLVLCGKLKHIKSDVCIVDLSQNEILLVAQEHKMMELVGIDKARIQLVAGAVAAFNHNTLQRKKLDFLSWRKRRVISSVCPFFSENLSLLGHTSSSWPARCLLFSKFQSLRHCRLIFAMGPIHHVKPVGPIVIRLFLPRDEAFEVWTIVVKF